MTGSVAGSVGNLTGSAAGRVEILTSSVAGSVGNLRGSVARYLTGSMAGSGKLTGSVARSAEAMADRNEWGQTRERRFKRTLMGLERISRLAEVTPERTVLMVLTVLSVLVTRLHSRVPI